MVDSLERLHDWFKGVAVFTAGILFGAGWWIWGDAITVAVASGAPFPPLSLAPGLIATLAILVMNCVPRSEVSSDNVYGDDATLCRNRLTLFIAYTFSVAAVATAVGLLLNLKAQQADLYLGAAGIVQACLVVAAGCVCWFFRDGDGGMDYGYM